MSSHQETPDIQDTEFGGPAVSTERRIIHFSSGETLEEEDSEEEEEQSSNRPPFTEPARRFSFKNVASLVGRTSLWTCDFLGERLAGALGLNAAKYQYAIDQHHRDHQTSSSQPPGHPVAGQVEKTHFSPDYGATGDVRCPAGSQASCDEEHMDRDSEGCHNRAYQAD